MTIGDLISFNVGSPCDSIRVVHVVLNEQHVILNDTKMYKVHHSWLSLNIDKYYVYPDEDNFTAVTFTVYVKDIKGVNPNEIQ